MNTMNIINNPNINPIQQKNINTKFNYKSRSKSDRTVKFYKPIYNQRGCTDNVRDLDNINNINEMTNRTTDETTDDELLDNNQLFGISENNRESIQEHNFNNGKNSKSGNYNNNSKSPITVYLHENRRNKSRL